MANHVAFEEDAVEGEDALEAEYAEDLYALWGADEEVAEEAAAEAANPDEAGTYNEGEPGAELTEPTAGGASPSSARFKVDSKIYSGLVYRVGPKTGNLLIKSFMVNAKYGMEAMILKGSNTAGASVCDKITFKVVEREGQRPLATSVRINGRVDRIIPDKGKGKDKGEAKGKAGGKASGSEETKGKGTVEAKGKSKGQGKASGGEEMAFAGTVARQSAEAPFKYFIDCKNVTAAFGFDAWFLPADKPQSVTIGSVVVFAINPTGRTLWVCKLAPLSEGLWKAQAAAAAKAGARSAAADAKAQTAAAEKAKPRSVADGAPGVQKTIAKKGKGKPKGTASSTPPWATAL